MISYLLTGLRWSSFLAFGGVYLSVSLIGVGVFLTSILSFCLLVSDSKETVLVLKNPLFRSLACLILMIILSIVLAPPYPFHKPLEKIFYLLAFFGITRMFLDYSSSFWFIEKFAWGLSVSLGFLAILQGLGLLEQSPLFLHKHVKALPGSSGLFLATGFTFHHTPFAASLIWLFHLNLARLFEKGPRANLFFSILGILFCFIGILLSFSRGAWLALLASVILVLIITLKLRGLWILLTAISLSGVLFVPDSAFKTRLSSYTLSQNQERLFLWKKSIEMFKDRPLLGHGYHSYGSTIEKYLSPDEAELSFPRDSHNMYLDMLAGTGILGIGAFFYFLWSSGQLIIVLLKKKSLPQESRRWVIASWGGLTAFCVAGFFDRHFYMSQTLVPLLFFLGGTAAIAIKEASADTATNSPLGPG